MEKMEFSGKQKAEAMQYQWTKRADVWKTEALVLILLTAFAFVINRHMEIKGLYMDDLYQWFCFNDNPFSRRCLPAAEPVSVPSTIWWHGQK